MVGEDPPKDPGDRSVSVTTKCDHCGVEFKILESRLRHGRGKHCSRDCQYAARRDAPKAQVELECIGCGRSFNRAPSQLKRRGGGKFCSRKCRDENWRGELTSRWLGGRARYYGPNWSEARAACLARDGNICQECGHVDESNHAHHDIPFRLFSSPEAANELWNLITLCEVCHQTVEARSKWAPTDGGVVRLRAGGAAHELAKAAGLL